MVENSDIVNHCKLFRNSRIVSKISFSVKQILEIVKKPVYNVFKSNWKIIAVIIDSEFISC